MGLRVGNLAEVTGASLASAVRAAQAQTALSAADLLSLTGPMPDRLLYYPLDLIPGDKDEALRILEGSFTLPGGTARAPGGAAPWDIKAPNNVWAEELNGFCWLRHLNELAPGREDVPAHVRWLITTWMASLGRWDELAWRPHVIARRLISWFANGRLIVEGSDLIWRSRLLVSISRQAKHLNRTAGWLPEGPDRFTAAVGLCFSALCLPHPGRRLSRGLNMLDTEVRKQILADGGHITRSPEAGLLALADLVALKDALIAREKPVPDMMQNAIDRMMPTLRFFRHGDGQLALFNGGTEGKKGAVDAVLKHDDTDGRPLRQLRHAGYQRITAGRTLVLVDTGTPPDGAYSENAHAGALSMEMSVGRCRLITNCGATELRGPEWQEAFRSTAAHSTLTLSDSSSCTFMHGKAAIRILGQRIITGPRDVDIQRTDEDHGAFIETTHDGYVSRFGLRHMRKVFLNAEGDDVRGEDALLPTNGWAPPGRGKPPLTFAVRFHLHPDVRASLARDGGRVILLLPNGDGWQFRATGGAITLESSAYLGAGEGFRRAEQIVVASLVRTEKPTVKWGIKRLARTSDAPAK